MQLRQDFLWSSSLIIGLGMKGTAPRELKEKSWIYFSEKEFPFIEQLYFQTMEREILQILVNIGLSCSKFLHQKTNPERG